MPGNRQPGHSPPVWPRLAGRRASTPAIGGLAPAPVEIPLCWLTGQVMMRQDPPRNYAEVTQASTELDAPAGGVWFAENTASIADHDGVFPAPPVTLTSPTHGDAPALAEFTVDYGADPRMRLVQATVDLMHRAPAEWLRCVRIQKWQRIRFTGTPPEFPQGADSLIVVGIAHEIGLTVRRVTWTLSPTVGDVPGTPGPWFRVDSSELDGTDLLPY